MRLFPFVVAIPTVALGVAACVGDDPDITPSGEEDEPDAAVNHSPDGAGDAGAADAPESDSSSDASAGCDGRPFTTPVRMSDVSEDKRADDYPRFSLARDELFLGREVNGIGNYGAQVGLAVGVVRYARADGGTWGAPTTLAFNDIGDGGKMNASSFSMTEDGKAGFLVGRDGYSFFAGVRTVTRSGPNAPWSIPMTVTLKGPDGQAAQPLSLFVNADGKRLYYSANSGGKELLYQATLTGGTYGDARLLGFDARERSPVLSHDELRIFFGSARPHPGGVTGTTLVYTAARADVDGDFGPIEFVAELNEGAQEMTPSWLSADGCTMLLSGRLPNETSTDVFIATRAP